MKKILLIHGWNHKNYTSSGNTDAWNNRSAFVKALSNHLEVLRVNLPGFGGENDPSEPWTIDNFSQFVGDIIHQEKPDVVLGYSFGGAVLLHWKKISKDKNVKAILVSPAIIRRYEKRQAPFFRFKKFIPNKLLQVARNFYLTKVVKNPFYSEATPVMKETYRNIVGLDLRDDLHEVSDSLVLIYGEVDSATPPDLVREVLSSASADHEIHIIAGGGHDIANTHTEELTSVIINSTKGD